ncbi:hypothetical protein Tco_1137895 [Tanacetum coccineum]
MAPKKRTTRSSPATTTTTTPVTNAQLKAFIDQGVADALAVHDANRSWNGDDSHNSGKGSRRTERTARECTYTDFLKCQPMNFKDSWCKGTELGKLYTTTFQELALTSGGCFLDRGLIRLKKYVGGLPDMIHGSVKASKPKTMQEAIEFCNLRWKGVNILISIDDGPFQMGIIRDPIAEGTEDKERYNADIRATNILLQGLPKDIYSLINHYTDIKDIWDNVKMLLEGETIHDYYVRFAKLINDMRNIKMTMSRMQLNSKFVNNMLPEWGRFVTAVKLNRGAAGYEGAQNRVGNANPGQARQENGMELDEEKLLFIVSGQDNDIDEDVDEQPIQDLALNVDNVF